MFAYVARQPIFDAEKHVVAYELLFRDGVDNRFPDINPDEATSKILAGSHLNLGVEEITGGKQAYINFHQDTLLYRFPTSLDPMNVVIEVVETVELNSNLLKACKHIRDLGYRVALDDYDFDPKWDEYLPHVDVIKVDIKECSLMQISKGLQRLSSLNVTWVAEKIETVAEFNKLRMLGFTLFQGYFFARPEIIKHKKIGASQMAVMELLDASCGAKFDIERLNTIFERDVALSYMLLRFINNPTVNKRNEITSLRHALNYMGQVEVRKFIALLSLAKLSNDKPKELMTTALARAKFCELIADIRGEINNPPTGFLVGLFSLLDTMLDQSMQDLMAKMPLSAAAKKALCGQENNFGNYLRLARCYEQGDWAVIKSLSIRLKVSPQQIDNAYQQSLLWANSLSAEVA